MALENVSKFHELVRTDEAIQAKLNAALKSYDGPTGDEKAAFAAVIAPIAAEAGLPYTFEEGVELATSERDLSDEELEAVAGGSGACYFVGISDKPDAWLCENPLGGTGSACVYAGVTLA